jgi:hypothetical protein
MDRQRQNPHQVRTLESPPGSPPRERRLEVRRPSGGPSCPRGDMARAATAAIRRSSEDPSADGRRTLLLAISVWLEISTWGT